MKCKPLLFLIFLYPKIALAQMDTIGTIEPYFFSLIVQNIDSSIQWYTQVMNFSVLDRNEVPARTLKIANLQSGHSLIELIESGSAVPMSDALSAFETKSRMQGIFKIGFLVSDLEPHIARWEELGVNSVGDVVTNPLSGKRMVIIQDPDGNRIQIFEK